MTNQSKSRTSCPQWEAGTRMTRSSSAQEFGSWATPSAPCSRDTFKRPPTKTSTESWVGLAGAGCSSFVSSRPRRALQQKKPSTTAANPISRRCYHPAHLLPRIRRLARAAHLKAPLVDDGRGARPRPQAHPRCRERGHHVEDVQVHAQSAHVVDLRAHLRLPGAVQLLDHVHGAVASCGEVSHRDGERAAYVYRPDSRL